MWEWQWQVLRRRYFAHPLRQEVHVPVATQRRRVCHFCKRGRTGYECTGCGKAFHVLCFAPGHGYGGVQGARDMEVDEEDEEVWEEDHEEDEEDGEDEEVEEDEEDEEGEEDEEDGEGEEDEEHEEDGEDEE